MPYENRLRREDYSVEPISLAQARSLIEQFHYAKGCSHTAVATHGLICNWTGLIEGCVHWLPPTKPAAKSVADEQWRDVLSLSRMVVVPGAPKNACSFMLAQSVKLIKQQGRWKALVTYADSRVGHEGGVYRAAGWAYFGKTSATPAWIDPTTGKQVATLSTKTRTKTRMLELGYEMVGKFYKHKFVRYLDRDLHLRFCEL